LAATPGTINFGAGLGTLGFVLSNAGGGVLNVTSVAEFPVNTPWLEIEPTGPVGPDGLGVYLLHVDRTGLVENNYATTIRIQSGANTIEIPVNMTVASNPFAGDIGEFRVKLYFAEDLTRITSIAINSNDGSFEFTNVDSGCYVVAAGTNVDDDLYISDVGEAWGVYRSKSEFVSLILDADATNIDFEVAFDAPLFLPTGDGGGPAPVDQPAL
jgi:serine protease